MTATVEVAGPFDINSKPYVIAATALGQGSERQEQDRAVGVTGLFFIVAEIALGVIFAIVMVAGHGKRQYP